MIFWLLSSGSILTAIILVQKYRSLSGNILTVLMYHKISVNSGNDRLTVPALMLERQFHYLNKAGYTPILLSQLSDFLIHKKQLPLKPVLITFDDGYHDNFAILYPLVLQYGMKANIFLVATFIECPENKVRQSTGQYLSSRDIKSMDPSIVEFGLHSYNHRNYNELSILELNEDIIQTKSLLEKLGIPFQSSLAFPYGAYPKKSCEKTTSFFKTLSSNNILTAFRIGNRLNRLPLKNRFLIQRLDIRGDMSFKKFTRLLKKENHPSNLYK
ncbi:MAG: polysaccharide deacetylase family protein [Ferruginibacter sp.]